MASFNTYVYLNKDDDWSWLVCHLGSAETWMEIFVEILWQSDELLYIYDLWFVTEFCNILSTTIHIHLSWPVDQSHVNSVPLNHFLTMISFEFKSNSLLCFVSIYLLYIEISSSIIIWIIYNVHLVLPHHRSWLIIEMWNYFPSTCYKNILF